MASKGRVKPPPPAIVRLESPTDRVPPAPCDLSPAMQDWWRNVLAEYDLEQHHLHLLEAAAGAWDRMTQARDAIHQHGMTYTDERGMIRARPEVAIERDARIACARIVRELDLDPAPSPEPRRRPLASNRDA